MPFLPIRSFAEKRVDCAAAAQHGHSGFQRPGGCRQSDPPEVFAALKTSENGLSEEEAEERLEQHGPNVVTQGAAA